MINHLLDHGVSAHARAQLSGYKSVASNASYAMPGLNQQNGMASILMAKRDARQLPAVIPSRKMPAILPLGQKNRPVLLENAAQAVVLPEKSQATPPAKSSTLRKMTPGRPSLVCLQ